MAIAVVADTHAVIWHLYNDPRLSVAAARAIADAQKAGGHIGLSSISLVELVFLMERSRVKPDTLQRALAELRLRNATFVEVPVEAGIVESMRQFSRTQVPELPDRIIAATAAHFNVPLISRDPKIQASGIQTIW